MAPSEVGKKKLSQEISNLCFSSTCLLVLLISPWFYGLTRFRDQLLTEILVFGLFSFSVSFQKSAWELRPGDRQIDIVVFLSLFVCLGYVVFSILPYQSFLAFLRFASCVVFYFLIRLFVQKTTELRVGIWAVLISGTLYSGYGLLQYYGLFSHDYWYQPDSLASRFVNGGHFGALLLFSLFFGISLLPSCKSRTSQIGAVLCLGIIAWAFLLTRTRTVWLSFVFGVFFFLGLINRYRLLHKKFLWGALWLVVLGGGLLLVRGGAGEVIGRFRELWDNQDTPFYSLIYRVQLWQGSLRALAENPMGFGLGTFASVFPAYRVHPDRFLVDYAHNEFLQVGVDMGLPGIFFLAVFIFIYFWRGFNFLNNGRVPSTDKILGAGFLSLAASLILSIQVDFPLRIHAVSLYLSAYLAASALLFSPSDGRGVCVGGERFRQTQFRRGFYRAVSGVLVFLLMIFAARQLYAQIHFEKGRSYEKDFEWPKATLEYGIASRLVPAHAEYQAALGSLLRQRAALSMDRIQKKQLRKAAIEAYEKTKKLQPYLGLYPYLLTLLYEEEKELSKARSEFLTAISLEPKNALFVSEYGYFALRNSLPQEAIGAFERFKDIPFKEGTKSDLIEILKSCYRLTQDYRQLERVIPDTPEGHYSLGFILGENGQWDLAKAEFERALKRAASENREGPLGQHIENFYRSHGLTETPP